MIGGRGNFYVFLHTCWKPRTVNNIRLLRDAAKIKAAINLAAMLHISIYKWLMQLSETEISHNVDKHILSSVFNMLIRHSCLSHPHKGWNWSLECHHMLPTCQKCQACQSLRIFWRYAWSSLTRSVIFSRCCKKKCCYPLLCYIMCNVS